MIRYLILIFFVYSVLSAQNKREVELPDFVVTGVQQVNFPEMEKIAPDLNPTLSKEFFSPVYSPGEFDLAKISKPPRKIISPLAGKNFFTGIIRSSAGINRLPELNVNIKTGIPHFLLNTGLFGKNVREYEKYKGYFKTGGYLLGAIFVDDQASAFPGLEIIGRVEYSQSRFNLFGSATPSLERTIGRGKFRVSFLQKSSSVFNYHIITGGERFKITDHLVNDTESIRILLEANGGFEWEFLGLRLEADGNIMNVKNEDDYSPDFDKAYMSGKAVLSLARFRSFGLGAGAYYAKLEDENFFSPVANLFFKAGKFITLSVEYQPGTDLVSAPYLFDKNACFTTSFTGYDLTKYKNRIKAALKYEFEKYIEVIAGGEYYKGENYAWFSDTNSDGIFKRSVYGETTNISGFLKLYFHTGPNGRFYAELNARDIKSNEAFIPFLPRYSGFFNYSVDLLNKLTVYAGATLHWKSYTNINNIEELPFFADLNIGADYIVIKDFSAGLEIKNILNRENYYFPGYSNIPLDLLLNLSYGW